MHCLSTGKKGFTFVEIIIAVIILAALAALVVPQLGRASAEPDLAALAATLQTVRTQLQYYKLQHDDTFPSLAQWEKQMLRKTKPNGSCSARGSCGPYLLQVPANPLDGSRNISPLQDGSGGWMYDEKTGQFSSNDPSVLEGDSQTKDL